MRPQPLIIIAVCTACISALLPSTGLPAVSISFEADFDKTGITAVNPGGMVDITSNISLSATLSIFKAQSNKEPWEKSLDVAMDFYFPRNWSLSFIADVQPLQDGYSKVDGKGSVSKTFGEDFQFSPSFVLGIIQHLNTGLHNSKTGRTSRVAIIEDDLNPILQFALHGETRLSFGAVFSEYFIFLGGQKISLADAQSQIPLKTAAIFYNPATHNTTGNFMAESYNIAFSQLLFSFIKPELSYTRDVYLLKDQKTGATLYDSTYEPSLTFYIGEKLSVTASMTYISPSSWADTASFRLSSSCVF